MIPASGATLATRWGYLGLLVSARGLEQVLLPRPDPEDAWRELERLSLARGLDLSPVREPDLSPAGGPDLSPGEGLEEKLLRWSRLLEGYGSGAGGHRQEFPWEELAWEGVSDFAARVYRALAEIPWGETRTYGQVAARLGCPGAARAVGRACARNPWPLVIPCHRVVGGRGPGGYGGGRALKEALLAWEKENR